MPAAGVSPFVYKSKLSVGTIARFAVFSPLISR